jgi:hypothetical protein
MRRAVLIAIALAATLPACGQAPVATLAGLHARPAAGLAVRDAADNDLAFLHDVGEEAKQTQKDIQAKYIELGLNTSAGRKFTPARETELRDGLGPLLGTLDQRIAGWVSRLQADGRYGDVAKDLTQRRPALGEALPADASAADMLYRLAQYRLKLGALIEYAVRHGAVAED